MQIKAALWRVVWDEGSAVALLCAPTMQQLTVNERLYILFLCISKLNILNVLVKAPTVIHCNSKDGLVKTQIGSSLIYFLKLVFQLTSRGQ